MSEKLEKEELKDAAGGSTYDCDWLVTCDACKNQFVIHGYEASVLCGNCRHTIYLCHGEGSVQKLN